MNRKLSRRRLLESACAAGGASFWPGSVTAAPDGFRIAPFRFDVTPPKGHPLCGGWITPVVDVEDALEAIGFVLLGAGAPIVVCAVDWTGILNEAHIAWRGALAEAAGTTPERVAVHCVHQHDAPFVCPETQRILDGVGAGLVNLDPSFFRDCLRRGAEAVREAVEKARPFTHLARAESRVSEVAGNRRVLLGADGKVAKMRGSACRDPELIALPEGLIDPMLKTVAFYSGEEKVVACHYYACHPMSHYGQGHVSSDYPGLARKRRQAAEPGCVQIYFTGASGNIAAGKYNDGSPEARVALTGRIFDAMTAAGRLLRPEPVRRVEWSALDLVPEVNPVFTLESEMALVTNPANAPANRIRPAMRAAWIKRLGQRVPIVLSALHIDATTLLHLPAESFVEYQLRAQEFAGKRFVATAAYGDGGPWYIPTREAFPQGGYEVSVANCSPAMDPAMTEGIQRLLGAAG
ncbi:MAG: hypothetical protein KGS60_01525 [Verrucomicrobia bacterium]|nr:hypothetical protein [Verrucomicrobiota bacterium]